MMAALRFNLYFRKFTMINVKRVDVITLFADTLQYNTTIEEIILRQNGASDGFIKLGNSLKANTANRITRIDLSGNDVGEKGIASLASAFESFTHSLYALDLVNCKIDPKGISCLFLSLKANPKSCCELERFNFSDNLFGNAGSLGLSLWLSTTPTLVSQLMLAETKLDVHVLSDAVDLFLTDKLRVLDLSDNKLDMTGALSLCQMLGKVKVLTNLSLESCSLHRDAPEKIVKAVRLFTKKPLKR